MVKLVDFQHLGNRSDAGNGLFAEGANTIGDGAHQLLIDVDGAPAHAGHHAGIFRLVAVQPN